LNSSPAAEHEEGFPWVDDLQARGIWLTGDQLAPPRRARSVRVREGVEIRGGELIECGSVDEAVEIAASHPLSQIGAIEVRPLWRNS
jgi:hypothetical protein